MSFINLIKKYEHTSLKDGLNSVTAKDIKAILSKDILAPTEFLALLSPGAVDYLEDMAQKAHKITLKNFGKTIQLYTPMYLSNYCDNHCIYCGFNVNEKSARKKLTMDELEIEAQYIADTGLKHVLILTGSSKSQSPLLYIKDSIRVLKRYFSSISIEIYPLTEDEYGELIAEGIDGLTIYQETYNRAIYDKVHLKGPKRDYEFRLDSAERALNKKMRTANIGALLGLSNWRDDGFFVGLHAQYLQDKFPEAEIAISVPRIRPQTQEYSPCYQVLDRDIVQLILALRIFLPRIGIALSTRESQELRDNILPLGVTKISADSTTAVGGHTSGSSEQDAEQFSINDKRSVSEVREFLLNRGYQPVLKDW